MISLLPFLFLVLIHHFLLAPLLRKKLPLYIVLTFSLLIIFGAWCFSSSRRPDSPPPPPPHELEWEGPAPEDGAKPIRPEATKLLIGILLIGVDLGFFFYLESRRKERRMKELQAENLSQRLESLRYQINPHFFMNTLNNIHALVDIDPDKAKESIEVFSKMMRILLYEGDSPTIPLARELDFIRHFISLMRLRYPEDLVRIESSFPEDCSGQSVPPLVMASFVENAFKHGVSYSAESFIRIKVQIQEDKLIFFCFNSLHPSKEEPHAGVGLENVRNRLSLLYGNSYTLSIDESDGRYDVLMAIPSHPDFQES